MTENLRMDAYYYGFVSTGVVEIDMILSAIACAGKAYHHTESWNDESEWEPHEGKTPIDWIQNAANKAAAEINSLREQRFLRPRLKLTSKPAKDFSMVDLVQQLREGVAKKYSRESLETMLLWAADEIERLRSQLQDQPAMPVYGTKPSEPGEIG